MDWIVDLLPWIKGAIGILFAFGLLIFFHELGHFIGAKVSGIGVEIFALNFGRPLIKFTYRNVVYQIGWIPFGGYCKMKGQADFGAEETKGEPDEFYNRPAWARLVTVIAGPLFSYILGVIMFIGILFFYGEELHSTKTIAVPAKNQLKSQLQNGDEVVAINNKPVSNWEDIDYILQNEMTAKTIQLKIKRNNEEKVVYHSPSESKIKGKNDTKADIYGFYYENNIYFSNLNYNYENFKTTIANIKSNKYKNEDIVYVKEISKSLLKRTNITKEEEAFLSKLSTVSNDLLLINLEDESKINNLLSIAEKQLSSNLSKAGIENGDRLKMIEDLKVGMWSDIYDALNVIYPDKKEFKLTVQKNPFISKLIKINNTKASNDELNQVKKEYSLLAKAKQKELSEQELGIIQNFAETSENQISKFLSSDDNYQVLFSVAERFIEDTSKNELKTFSVPIIEERIAKQDSPNGNKETKNILGIALNEIVYPLPINNDTLTVKSFGLFAAVGRGWVISNHFFKMVFTQFDLMFSGKIENPEKALGGPIKIAQIFGQMVNYSLYGFFKIVAVISIF